MVKHTSYIHNRVQEKRVVHQHGAQTFCCREEGKDMASLKRMLKKAVIHNLDLSIRYLFVYILSYDVM